ncbi:EamA family transporter [Alkalibaculum sp. M08DMB]|uniref:EamA family transporter n=1 Tax=Alkalibaculum sporogenes TaxID=2655001 RepID=A0A6A7K7V8_9FIRM|nr:DMT family transporter [Alkalibaculum sporogenes]MPW25442.1 EamA family transporter [Alkalibaculum sporogenes]
MRINKEIAGHLSAVITILIWGTTFISTKLLLVNFTPIEILFYRFGIGLLVLIVAFPHRLKETNIKQEMMFAGAGLCGVTLYFLLENIALTYTLASNVGVIISIAPFFVALFSYWFLDNEKIKFNFFIGFFIAIIGIALINFNGSMVLKLNPIGDLLAVLAAIVWAVYSILTRKISQFGFNTIQTTRKTFFYGILFMIPVLFILPFEFGIERFSQPINIFNILFLGLGASALCFVTWNTAVKLLGAVKTSIYIYMVPAITVITSILVLSETITWIAVCGMVLTLVGLFISERKTINYKKEQ